MTNKQELREWVETLSEDEAVRMLKQLRQLGAAEEARPEDDFERLLTHLTRFVNPSVPPLSDEAVTRESIYD